ncbi:hypothetical protein [Ensifer sp. LCM 4579]|uniref:hypothetical protein n=1 Tax=Ensifer sp. LCM 4579 TaxID=1848292 RepID=UPI0010422DF7|nr:hypothetical protein [Ensifer sp. LCM 4579]
MSASFPASRRSSRRSEATLELFADDQGAWPPRRERAVRCDEVEGLGEGFPSGWIMSPANIVHMVGAPGAW